MSTLQDFQTPDIKQMPPEQAVRDAIRQAADEAIARDAARPPTWDMLQQQGRALLETLALPESYLGFAMVAANNAFWRRHYAAVPLNRRLLLLPHCLSDKSSCAGHYDSVGLHCQNCGACTINDLKSQAEALGYQVIIAEGTSAVLMRILEGDADAILGVACLDSLEKSFPRIVDLGVPHIAVPLLRDGCENTEAEHGEITSFLLLQEESTATPLQSYIPLLRAAVHLFEETEFKSLLAPYMGQLDLGADDPLTMTDAAALDWLQHGGKRFRPFVTLAAYAVAKHGAEALAADAELDGMVPQAVRRIALAIEAMHKASLAHDDIEDNDEFRYGRQTLHRAYGVAPAINIGDYLVGLGYRLIAGEVGTLGAACVADVLGYLSAAHLELCRGQGAELEWTRQGDDLVSPRDIMAMYALKTAPAFQVAITAGLRAAGAEFDATVIKRFATFLGEGYQLLNDIEDWQRDAGNKVAAGRDVLARRPTLLRAFALEAGGGDALAALTGADAAEVVEKVHTIYVELGIFTKAERLLEKLRERASGIAAEVEQPALRELLEFLVRVVLRKAAQGNEHRIPGHTG